MSTTTLIQSAGVLAVLVALVLILAVVVLRLVALPLAAAALALDTVATLVARPLELPASLSTAGGVR